MKEKVLVMEKEWQQFWSNSSSRSNSNRSTVDNMSVVICLPYHYLNKFYISVRKANNISVSIIVQKVH